MELSRRTRTPEVRTSQILAAAKSCFRKTGFHATTMAEIAAAAGISAGLAYRYFPSKDAIIEAIVLEDLEWQKRQFAEMLDSHSGDPVAAIEDLILITAPAICDFDRIALMLEISAETMRNPKMRALGAESRQEMAEMFRARMGAAAKTISDEEIEARLAVFGGLVTGVGIHLYVNDLEPGDMLLALVERAARRIIVPGGDDPI